MFFNESFSSFDDNVSNEVDSKISGSRGLYWGFLIDSDLPIYIGILTPVFSGKNLPKSKVEDKSY